MAPAPKVDKTIVPLFTNQWDPRPQKLMKSLFIVYKSVGPPAPKVDKTIVPLFIGKNLDSPRPQKLMKSLFIVYCSNGKNPKSLIINHLN